MSFITGLVNRVTQGLETRLGDKRAEERQKKAFDTQMEQRRQMMPLELEAQQLSFEQRQRQQMEAQPQALDMKEAEMRRLFEVKKKLDAEAQKIPIQTSPGLREALAAGDMEKLPALVQTQGDVDFLNLYRQTFRQMLSSDPDHAYKIQAAREKARTEGFKQRSDIKETYGGKSSGGSASGKTVTVKTKDGKEKRVNPSEVRQIKNSLASEVKKFREDPRFFNELGQFDEQKLVGTPEQFQYAKLLQEYKEVAQLENELNSKRLKEITGKKDNSSGSYSAFDRFSEFSNKVLDALRPKERNVVKKSQAKQ